MSDKSVNVLKSKSFGIPAIVSIISLVVLWTTGIELDMESKAEISGLIIAAQPIISGVIRYYTNRPAHLVKPKEPPE